MAYSGTPGAIIRIGVDGAAESRREIDTVARTMSNLSNTVQNAMRNLAASVGIGAGVAGIVQMSDEYAKFTAQLRLATQSQREYAAAYADVKRIASTSQQGLAETGVLYARIANGTRELGTTQKQVAAITETVNMALKVSGATATEAASAQLQLSQAFASGTLRGEEFNAVNEAAPRLMKALADGMGLPVGALKKMAEEGKITSEVMAAVLPASLEKLRDEARQVQTVSGAFTVLKNEVMEFIGVQSNASGAVSGLVSGINILSNNLGLLAGVIVTVGVSKLATMLSGWGIETYKQIAANNALRTSTLASAVASTEAAATMAASKLAEAQANVRTAATAANLASARVAELRSAVLAADGAVALAIATNGLIPAQARALALEEARTASLAAQAVASNAATVATGASAAALTAQAAATGIAARAMGILRGAMMFLGGPIGAIVTLLGLGATAWMVWGNKAKESNETAAESFDEAQARIIKGLDAQIEKNERLLQLKNLGASKGDAEKALPFVNQLAAASERLNKINSRTGEFAGKSNTEIDLDRIKVMRDITELTEKMGKAEKTGAAVTAATVSERVAAFKKEHATKQEQMNAELKAIEDLKGKTSEYDEMVRRIRAKYADKGAAAALKQEASAYATLMTSIKEKMAAQTLEEAGYSKMTDAQKMTIQLDAEIATGKNILSKSSIAAARADIAVIAARDAALVSAANVTKSVQELNDDRNSAYAAVMGEVTANEELVATYGMTKLQIEQLTLARLEDRLAQRAALELDAEEVAQLERMIAAKRRNMTAVGKLDVLERGSDLTKAKELLDIMTSIDEVTRSAAAGMAESFGRVGAAIGDMTTTLSGYGRAQAAIAAQLAAEKKDAANDPVKIKAAETRASQAAATAQIRQYGDMAKAAKGFFKENTAGYKVMEGAEKAFRAYEMAMSIKSMVEKSGLLTAFTGLFVASKTTQTAAEGTSTAASTAMAGTQASAWGVTAVVKAIASMPFPLNIAAGAATLAAVVAIGAKMMGGLGGGGAPSLSEQRQASQGTGSVLGASTTKSESIARSLELSLANSNIELNYTADMLRSLRSIESSLSGLGGVLIRAGVDGIVPATTGIGGGWLGKVGNSIFGGKTEALDTGVMSNRTTVAGVLAGGLNAQKYTDMKKDGGWFHSDKRWTDTQSLGAATNQQFSAAIAGMVESVKEAGSLLGIEGDAFNNRLSSFVVDFGKISFKGMSGEDIQTALEGVFSKIADDMAQWSVQGLTQFQKVGEGHLETLVRISANYANLDASLKAINMTFGATGMSSIAARESLISLVGGMDELSSKTASFGQNFLSEQERLAPLQKYVTEQLTKMGLGYIDTREEFKNHVLGLKLVTAAEQQQFAQLMDLESAFAKVTAQAKDLSRSAQDIADERADLQNEWDELTMTSAQLQAKARLAIDPSNRALFDQIALQRDLKATTEAASEALKGTVERLGATQASTLAYRDSLLLGNLSTLTPMEKYLETQRQYIEALRKAEADPADSTAALAAQSAATAFLTASQVINASSAAFVGDKSKVMGDMGRLAAIAGQQMTDAQRQLSALDKQVVGIAQLNDTAAAIQQAIANQAVGGPVVAPLFDVQRYAASSGEAAGVLAAEVKALREDNAAKGKVLDAVLAELKLLRTDANRNADAYADAAEEAGRDFGARVGDALEEVAHIVANPPRVAPR